MITPYDWQEGIGNRAQYIEGKLEAGAPVLALALPEGVLLYTRRRQAQKLYEVYDRLALGAVGQQSDVEAVRMAALEFASHEGFGRSEDDVTIQRVVTAVSTPVKRAFADFGTVPIVARTLFAEVGPSPEADVFYVLDYDGDYEVRKGSAYVLGPEAAATPLGEFLDGLDQGLSAREAAERLDDAWEAWFPDDDPRRELEREAVLLRRDDARENRFESI